MGHKNSFRCVAFSQRDFMRVVLERSGAPMSAPNDQVEYLAQYLDRDLGAKTLLIEDHYIDRHFMEEVSLYYSSCFVSKPNSCARLHFFKTAIDDEQLDALLVSAAQGEGAAVAARLQASYLGYVVVRPLPSVPVGRTVLCPMRDDADRRFPTEVGYAAHILGLEIRVSGLAFQQQDVAVAACATTSVWTALQRVCRHEGERTPTPSAIAQAGSGFLAPAGRVLPSRGLTIEAMYRAIRSFGYSSVPFQPAADGQLFKLLVHVYVRSGIPVVLTTTDGLDHAVAVVGYRRDGDVPAFDLEGAPRTPPLEQTGVPDEDRGSDSAEPRGSEGDLGLAVLAHNLAYERIYIHDDRLGPYARARLLTSDEEPFVSIEIELPKGQSETFAVDAGLAPLYAKVRVTATQLFEAASASYHTVERYLRAGTLVGEEERIGIELFFERSGNYLGSLHEKGLDAARLAAFLRAASLSRYVGVLRFYAEAGTPLLDVVLDTTDVFRDRADPFDLLLAVVALSPRAHTVAEGMAHDFDVVAG